MKKIFLLSVILLLNIVLFGCNLEEKTDWNSLNDSSKIVVTGNGLEQFFSDAKELKDREIVFEQTEEIEVFIKAIQDSSAYSGPMTAESANFNITFFSQEESSQTFRLWLYPERNAGRIQKESENEPTYLLSEESVQMIAKLLTEKS
ncbi:hypothetical protein CD798_15455 [Bacillaceae bacterium SAOS 7]|nr:hypothetical protein CD798_15455 [Bacillaceae bacterium SAOS 7]